jgi:hypothetical protein
MRSRAQTVAHSGNTAKAGLRWEIASTPIIPALRTSKTKVPCAIAKPQNHTTGAEEQRIWVSSVVAHFLSLALFCGADSTVKEYQRCPQSARLGIMVDTAEQGRGLLNESPQARVVVVVHVVANALVVERAWVSRMIAGPHLPECTRAQCVMWSACGRQPWHSGPTCQRLL